MDSDPDTGYKGPGARPGFWTGPALFFDGMEAKAHQVTVTIHPEGLEIPGGEAYGAGGVFGPKDVLFLEKHGGGFLQLGFQSLPGAMLEIKDGDAQRCLENMKSGGKPTFSGLSLAGKAGVLLAALALVVAFMYFMGLDMAVNGAMAVIPPKADRMLGDAVVATFDGKELRPEDSMAVRALERSADAVRSMGIHPADSIRILIVSDTSIKNAFAFPGGTLLVYTGMIRLMDDQEEWFGLLAHEAGHVRMRHGMHGIVRGSILGVGMSLLFGDVSGLGAVILDNAGTLMRLKYGRGDEADADAFASRHMAALGYSPEGLARLFRKFLKEEKQPGWAAFLSTHPATETRIAKLMAFEGGPEKGSGKGSRDSEKSSAKSPARPFALNAEEWAALKRL